MYFVFPSDNNLWEDFKFKKFVKFWSFCPLAFNVKFLLSSSFSEKNSKSDAGMIFITSRENLEAQHRYVPHSALANFRMRLGLGVPFLHHGQLSLFQSKRWLSFSLSIASSTFWSYPLDRYWKPSTQPPPILPPHSWLHSLENCPLSLLAH